MNSIKLIIKHKLWSLMKEDISTDINIKLLNYLFWSGKCTIIDEIKSKEVLQQCLKNLINNETEYKHEKKMFNYLLDNLTEQEIKEIINDSNDQFILLQWVKRNNNKNPTFNFLNLLPKNMIEEGLFLHYVEGTNNLKLINYGIEKSNTPIVKINDKYEINLLYSKEIKGSLKIKLLSKFNTLVKVNIIEIIFEEIKNQDEVVVSWLIEKYYNDINNHQNKHINILKISYNELTEKTLNKYATLFIHNEKSLFLDNLFEKIIKYKKQKNETADAILETCDLMLDWNIKITGRESNNIINKYINYDNMEILLTHKIFQFTKTDIISNSLFEKIYKSIENKIENPIYDICEKLLISNIKINKIESHYILIKHLTIKTMDYLLKSNLFNYQLEYLLNNIWKKDLDLGINIAKKIEKDTLWKYVESLSKEDKQTFEIAYYNDKFAERKKEKKLKI